MRLVILSIDDAKAALMVRQAEKMGLEALIWPGQLPTVTPDWPDRYRHPAKSLAIIRSYQDMLRNLPDDEGWFITQTDMTLPKRLKQPTEFTVYGTRRSSRHVCPHLFYLPADMREHLLGCWLTETRPVCETWQPLTRRLDVPNRIRFR